MANRHFTYSGLIPAVAYIRRSTNKQDKSLPEQRAEIERYANANGYTIVRWYEDDAISGDATECRYGFLEMHRKACNGRDFEVVLCWDSDRFGRFNSIEAGYWIHPLMKAGVRLVTVTEGPVNWDDFTGRMMYAMKQEGKHQFLVDLSYNVTRGMNNRAAKGHLCSGAPYGFDRMLVDESGQHRRRVKTGVKESKPNGWHSVLVPSDTAQEVETVRWLFTEYAKTSKGLRTLASELNSRRIPGPRGGAWELNTVRGILGNQAYVGITVWGKRREGKFNSARSGEIVRRERHEVRLSRSGKPLAVDNAEHEWIVKEGTHEPLVARDIFDAVQVKLEQRKRSKPDQAYPACTRQNNGLYELSGLVFCSKCGERMHGFAPFVNKDGKRYSYPKYGCSTYHTQGKSNPSGCGCFQIRQDMLISLVVRKLQTEVFGGNCQKKLEASIRKQFQEIAKSTGPTPEQIRREVTRLDQEIDRAADNFLKAPSEALEIMGAKIAAMKRQREALVNSAKPAREPISKRDIDSAVQAAVGQMANLEAMLLDSKPERRRPVFEAYVERIEVDFRLAP